MGYNIYRKKRKGWSSKMKKNLHETPGTVAYALHQRMSEIDFLHGLQAAKNSICTVLKDESIHDKPLALTYQREINAAKNMSHLMSIFSAYVTGLRVSSSKRTA